MPRIFLTDLVSLLNQLPLSRRASRIVRLSCLNSPSRLCSLVLHVQHVQFPTFHHNHELCLSSVMFYFTIVSFSTAGSFLHLMLMFFLVSLSLYLRPHCGGAILLLLWPAFKTVSIAMQYPWPFPYSPQPQPHTTTPFYPVPQQGPPVLPHFPQPTIPPLPTWPLTAPLQVQSTHLPPPPSHPTFPITCTLPPPEPMILSTSSPTTSSPSAPALPQPAPVPITAQPPHTTHLHSHMGPPSGGLAAATLLSPSTSFATWSTDHYRQRSTSPRTFYTH